MFILLLFLSKSHVSFLHFIGLYPCQTGPCAYCSGSYEYRNVLCLYRIVSYLYRTRSRPYQFVLISHRFCSYRTGFAHIAPVLHIYISHRFCSYRTGFAYIYIAPILLISHRFCIYISHRFCSYHTAFHIYIAPVLLISLGSCLHCVNEPAMSRPVKSHCCNLYGNHARLLLR